MVSTRWQWSVDLCVDRKETAVYRRRNGTQNNTKTENTQNIKETDIKGILNSISPVIRK